MEYFSAKSNKAKLTPIKIVFCFLRFLARYAGNPAKQSAPIQAAETLRCISAPTPLARQPLHLKKRGDGWVIYSVGRDLEDGGSKLDELEDAGIEPVAATK